MPEPTDAVRADGKFCQAGGMSGYGKHQLVSPTRLRLRDFAHEPAERSPKM